MVVLELLQSLFGKQKSITHKTVAEYKQDILVRSGREQFQFLLKKNIKIPVVLL